MAVDSVSVTHKKGAINQQLNLSRQDPPEKKAKKENPWGLKSIHVNAGYIVNNIIPYTGPMHIQNDNYGTDVTISGIQQTPRYNWENITFKKGHRFAPDEPQFIAGVNFTFNNNFGFELDAKHNKIIVDGYDQEVHFDGVINGEAVNGNAPLNTFMAQHEQTLGNMQISALATYTVGLPAPKNHRFAFITKAGPSLIVSNTRSNLVNPDGEFEQTTSKLGVVGAGVTVENGLRYELGPKLGKVGVEVAYAVSYLNYANYSMVSGGKGSHDAINGQFSIKLSKRFDIKKKK